MMDWIKEWQSYMLPMLLCGIVNAIVAYQKLYRDAKSPFFRPSKSLWFYLWLLIQIGFPNLFFFFYAKVLTKPTVNPEFYLTAIAIGFFFTLFVNSNSDIGFVSFSIDKLYAFVNKIIYDRIDAAQNERIAEFYSDLVDQLLKNPSRIDTALDYLKEYVEGNVSLKFEEKTRLKYQNEIARATQQVTPRKKAEATRSIAKQILRRRHYPKWLERAGCDQAFIDRIKK